MGFLNQVKTLLPRYAVCLTDIDTAAKTVDCSGFILAVGSRISVKFTNGNSAANPTLNVNSTGDKNIFYQDKKIADSTAIIRTGGVYDFVYDGINYEITGNVENGYGY